MVVLSGASDEVGAVEDMAKAFDVPPRQISIEARIVEMDADKARDAGFDWGNFGASVFGDQQWQRQGGGNGRPLSLNRGVIDVTANIPQAIRLLEEQKIATTRDAPRILTLNNHEATILDGQRVTYVTRYSSYANVFATDSMDAGLRLHVIPSLGESGYIRLDLKAELTTLSSNISGSPVKDGQIVENTVTVKDGQTVLLGGFTRTVDSTRHRRFPVLGTVLPFLFSREITDHSRRESFIVITPHVVDLEATLDPATQKAVEGK
jgi:type II secretory pathway component GspD/PulD (secretin)